LEQLSDLEEIRKRRGQDSNLRTSYPVTDLANRRFRPLSHLSIFLFAGNQAGNATKPSDKIAKNGPPGRRLPQNLAFYGF
jgi:hypothetical protein